MKLSDIISVVDEAYPDDGLIGQAATGKKVGDGLAEFIARELKDIYDDQDFTVELSESQGAIERAIAQLESVSDSLKVAVSDCQKVRDCKVRDLPLLMGELTTKVAQKYLEERIKKGGVR